jgi:hypothetical protein
MRGSAEWLASIGLGEYAQRFSDNAIDLSVVREPDQDKHNGERLDGGVRAAGRWC